MGGAWGPHRELRTRLLAGAIGAPNDWLGLFGLEVIGREDTEAQTILRVRGTTPVTRCFGHCVGYSSDPAMIKKFGTEAQEFRDTTLGGYPVTLKIDRQRYRCDTCRKTFYQPIGCLDNRRRMTSRMVNHIVTQCLQTTNVHVARDLGIDEGTVRAVFREWYEEQNRTIRFATPRVLGIDEIHLTQRMPRCVLTNVGEKRLFDILPNRKKDDLRPYFEMMPDRHRVEVFVADMWKAYHDTAREFMPRAGRVVDRFHIQRMANDGLDVIRKSVARKRTREERIQLKDVRFLLWRNAASLNEEEADQVSAWLQHSPELKRAYRIKEAFSAAFDEPTRREAERAFDRCLQSIPVDMDPAFHPLLTAFGNWREEILNYFSLGGVTNGYTESMNSLIRLLMRNGRGYSFEIMRARLLFNKEARSRGTSVKARSSRPRSDLDIGFATVVMPAADNYARDESGMELGPSIDALVEILGREPLVRESDGAVKRRPR